MDIALFGELQQEGLISGASLEKIKQRKTNKLFSLHWELRTILYLGILLLTGGLGILVYKNIDTIGHQVILFFIGSICAGSFFYCFKKKSPFDTKKVTSPNAYFDYILLLGCLSLLIFIGYFQYQYNVFGNRFGLATCIPMIVLFFSAYYFDHLGILSMAVTNLAAWLGITVTPLEILKANDFNNDVIICTGTLLGVLLIVTGYVSAKKKIKAHFEFTYTNFGMHILFISLLAATFYFDKIYFLGFLLLLLTAFYFYKRAKKEKSFYFILISTLYTYIGLSYVMINALDFIGSVGEIYLILFYFIGSAIGLVVFLIRMNKNLKQP